MSKTIYVAHVYGSRGQLYIGLRSDDHGTFKNKRKFRAYVRKFYRNIGSDIYRCKRRIRVAISTHVIPWANSLKRDNAADAARYIAMGIGLPVDHAAFDKASDACAAPIAEVSVEAMTSLAPVTLRFTPAGAKLLGLDGRATTKYVEVSMAKASAVVLRNKLYSLRRAPGLNQLKTIDAALNVIDAGIK